MHFQHLGDLGGVGGVFGECGLLVLGGVWVAGRGAWVSVAAVSALKVIVVVYAWVIMLVAACKHTTNKS